MKEIFDPRKMFEDQFVTSIELDAGFSIDAFCIEFNTQSALRTGAITARFARATYFTL